MTLVGGYFIVRGVSATIEDAKSKTEAPENRIVKIKDANVLTEKFREFLVKKGIIKCESLKDGIKIKKTRY